MATIEEGAPVEIRMDDIRLGSAGMYSGRNENGDVFYRMPGVTPACLKLNLKILDAVGPMGSNVDFCLPDNLTPEDFGEVRIQTVCGADSASEELPPVCILSDLNDLPENLSEVLRTAMEKTLADLGKCPKRRQHSIEITFVRRAAMEDVAGVIRFESAGAGA
ncbi:hypothetical protein HOE67_03630 [Candidatus Peregrinibacteria bacterium]|jgi:hypothetical protein|nr:hypothetical protein [Candidatus Peregrinibacteria bacterium]MBT4056176.1 hypothetical protein [Candidatus Peregrinibacteria bacterium]